MVTTNNQPRAVGHPHVPGWQVSLLPVRVVAAGHAQGSPMNIPREDAATVGNAIYSIVERAPSQMLIGIDLRGIALMPSRLWRQLGPDLHSRVVDGALGPDKRVLYVTGGDEELIRNLQWAFKDAAHEASSGAGKMTDRAALVPAAAKGYCGVLRLPYEEVFNMVNRYGSLTNEEVETLVHGRYKSTNANNYLTALADLGLVYRQLAPRPTGGYASRTYALSIPEKAMSNALRLV